MKMFYTLMVMTALALGSFAFAGEKGDTDCTAMKGDERSAKPDAKKDDKSDSKRAGASKT